MTTTGESKIAAATDIKDEIASQGHEVAGAAKKEAGALAQEVREQAGSVVSNARGQLEEQADAQTRKIGEGIQTAKRQLDAMTENAEPGLVTSLAQQLSGSLGSIGDTIDQGGLSALAEDVRSFARRQPGLFLLGAGAAGFVAARLLRHAGNGGSSQSARPIGSASEAQGMNALAGSSVTGGGIDADLGLPAGGAQPGFAGAPFGADPTMGESRP